jgi:hypothetical protein
MSPKFIDGCFGGFILIINSVIMKPHEYQWLSDAFSLNASLNTNSCKNKEETVKKLKSHLFDLKDLSSDLDSLIDEIN